MTRPAHRSGSLSQSRSTPNLPSLDSSPTTNVNESSTRSPLSSHAISPLPSPLHPQRKPPSKTTHNYQTYNAYADADEEEEDEDDEDTFDTFDTFYGAHHTHSTRSRSNSTHASLSSTSTTGDDDDSTSASSQQSASRHSHSPPSRSAPPISRSQSSHSLTTFAPPFYNRPPLPLPPSPSLTSLLRPTFSSATPSRPTTPDESENDAGPSARNLVAQSATTAAAPVPRAAPQVPTYEYYGFVLYLTAAAVFGIYILWSFLPSPFLHQLGIYYYPNRWWSLAIPAYLVACIVYIYVALAAYNAEVMTLPLSSVGNIVDVAASVAALDAKGRIVKASRRKAEWGEERKKRRRKGDGHARKTGGGGGEKEKKRKDRERRTKAEHKGGGHHQIGGPWAAASDAAAAAGREWDWRAAWSEGTDAVMDVPVGGVCEVLYGGG